MKHKKTLVAIILCIVLIFSAIAFVACDENDDNNLENSDYENNDTNLPGILIDYNTEILTNFKEIAYKLLKYGEDHYTSFYAGAVIVSKKFCELNDLITDFGNGFIGQLSLSANIDTNHFTSSLINGINIYFYENEESIPEHDETLQQFENMLIDCRDNNIKFEDILTLSSNSNILFKKEQAFIKNIVTNALYSNKPCYRLSINTWILNNYDYDFSKISGALIKSQTQSTTIGNCYEENYFLSKSIEHVYDINLDDLKIGFENNEYTNQSYFRLENDIYYAYIKENPGFIFRENDTGYTLSKYCYETEILNLTIPDEYKEKPITQIGNYLDCKTLTSISIPKSVVSIGQNAFEDCINLTNIIYKGTKTEWHAISKGFSWNSNTGEFTIHCTDGDLDKYGNEI